MKGSSLLVLSALLFVAACSDSTSPPAPRTDLVVEDETALYLPEPTYPEQSVAHSDVAALHSESSGDVQCVGTLPPGVYDNVTVPPGATCIFGASEIRGNVKALAHATLLLVDSRVGGSVIGDKSDAIQLRRNTIIGNIEIVEVGPSPVLEVALCGNYLPSGNMKIVKVRGGVGVSPFAGCNIPAANDVGGNLQIEDVLNDVPPRRMFVSQNFVRQNLQVYKTRGPREKLVFQNFVDVAVQCFDNTPPFLGGPNVAPKREGQCF